MLSRETLEFPGQSDEHFFTVLRYVERNALRAGLVERAEDWWWSGLWRRVRGTPAQRALLSDGPPKLPKDWLRYVNRPNSEAELAAVRQSVQRGQPYGDGRRLQATDRHLDLESTLRNRGRPKGG